MTNFGDYASAKAKEQSTRSLFGRGALDVLLYHSSQIRDDGVETFAHVYSVKHGILSHCRIGWELDHSAGQEDTIIETDEVGPASARV